MAPKTTKFGPGTLRIGDDLTGIAIEANILGTRIKWNVNQEDAIFYLSGDQEPGAITFDGELTGSLNTDTQDGTASLFDLSWDEAGNTLPFTFTPNTAEGTVVTGSIVITPLDFGADKFGDRLNSEFTWPIVGVPADVLRTYATTP